MGTGTRPRLNIPQENQSDLRHASAVCQKNKMKFQQSKTLPRDTNISILISGSFCTTIREIFWVAFQHKWKKKIHNQRFLIFFQTYKCSLSNKVARLCQSCKHLHLNIRKNLYKTSERYLELRFNTIGKSCHNPIFFPLGNFLQNRGELRLCFMLCF